jgi:hypothetical protein
MIEWREETMLIVVSSFVFETFCHIEMLIILTINFTTFKINMYILQKKKQ